MKRFVCAAAGGNRLVCSVAHDDFPAEVPAPDPTQLGPYGIGHQRYNGVALPTGNMTNISVWYPTEDASGTPANYETTRVPGAYGPAFPNSFVISSLYGALENAAPAPGTFPAIVTAHGSGPLNADVGRLTFFQQSEFLASHGFISVGFTYHSPVAAQIKEMNFVINYISTMASISTSVDQEKIAVLGYSLGGYGAAALAAGTSTISKNPAIKAVVEYDPLLNVGTADANALGTVKNITVPSMTIATLFPSAGSKGQNVTSGRPSYKVLEKLAVHNEYSNVVCPMIAATRDIAISQGVTEPLANPQGNYYGNIAFGLWTAAKNEGSQFCDVSAWTPAVDPSLIGDRKNTVEEPEFRRRINLLVLSFLKTNLAGVSGYETYISEDYIKQNFDSNDLTLSVSTK